MKIHDMDDENIEWKLEMFLPFTPEEEAEAKALIDASFTANDLQRYTEVDEGIPLEQLEEEMDAAIQAFEQGRR